MKSPVAVLWRGGHAIPGAAESIEAIQAAGKRVMFLTNNSTKSRAMYVHKIRTVLGLDVDEGSIIGSAFCAAMYVKRHCPDAREVFVVGEAGIHKELDLLGISWHGVDTERGSAAQGYRPEVDRNVDAVVVGLDTCVNPHCHYPEDTHMSRIVVHGEATGGYVAGMSHTKPWRARAFACERTRGANSSQPTSAFAQFIAFVCQLVATNE